MRATKSVEPSRSHRGSHTHGARTLLAVLILAGAALAQPWSVPTDVSNDFTPSVGPRIAAAPDGSLHAVWVDTALQEIRHSSRAPGGAWSASVAIGAYAGTTPFADGDARVAVGPDLTVHVLYADDSTGSSEVYHRFLPPGGSWSAPVDVSATPGTRSEFPEIGIDPGGTAHAVWIDEIDAWAVCCSEVYYASKPPGGAWTAPANLSSNPENIYPVRLAIGPGGSVHVVWSQEDIFPGLQNIYYASKSPVGSWGPVVNLTGSVPIVGRGLGGVAEDSSGAVHVLYHEGAGEIMYLSKPPGGSWGAAQVISGNPGSSYNPALAVTAGGIAHATWQDDTPGNDEILYAVLPPGGTWSAPMNLSNSPGASTSPSLAVAAGSVLHAAWSDDSSGSGEIFHSTSAARVGLEFLGTPSSPNLVNFRVSGAVGQPGNLAIVLLSASGTAGFALPDGQIFPLTFDGLTAGSLALLPYLTGIVDLSGVATTLVFPFPPIPPGFQFFAAAGTVASATAQVISITPPIAVVTQ